jgi:hypothetical protein
MRAERTGRHLPKVTIFLAARPIGQVGDGLVGSSKPTMDYAQSSFEEVEHTTITR